jgi:hypothetical protein
VKESVFRKEALSPWENPGPESKNNNPNIIANFRPGAVITGMISSMVFRTQVKGNRQKVYKILVASC